MEYTVHGNAPDASIVILSREAYDAIVYMSRTYHDGQKELAKMRDRAIAHYEELAAINKERGYNGLLYASEIVEFLRKEFEVPASVPAAENKPDGAEAE